MDSPPAASPLLLSLFTAYSRRYIARRFHALRVSLLNWPGALVKARPLVVFSNHAAWWDPLVALVLKGRLFPERRLYAPMDAEMLRRYRFFKKLGFFGVEQNSIRGAASFLRDSTAALSSEQSLLAITAQGRFADVRERPVRLAPGLGHLAARIHDAMFLPVSVEYVFWEESLPEILVQFGRPVERREKTFTAKEYTVEFENALASCQDTLAEKSCRRDPREFEIVLRGGAGQGGIYDLAQRFRSLIQGIRYQKEHGRL